jgi:glycine hydroxymethyltransferase
MFSRADLIAGFDPELAKAIADETRRQEDHVELIASENYASPRVMEAQGSQLTNKYAEGYPGKRYYGGCEYVDVAEQLAIDRCKQLFGADYANVQPHSGSQANQGGLLRAAAARRHHPGHVAGARRPPHPRGQGQRVRQAVQRGAVRRRRCRPDRLRRSRAPGARAQAEDGHRRVLRVFAGGRLGALPRDRRQVGAYLFVDMAHVAGLVAAGVYPNPVPHAHVVTSTTHKTLRGPRGGIIVASKAGMGDAAEDIEKKLQSIVFPGIQGGPLMHVIAAKAVAFKEALEPGFKAYQEQVVKNAQAMARVIIARGYKIVSGGTQNHLMLVDMIGKDVSGKQAEEALGKAHITVNKNSVPNDPRKPFVTSGLRIGTPAVTTRGYKEPDCVALAEWICDVLDNPNDDNVIAGVRGNVETQCRQFPVYGD